MTISNVAVIGSSGAIGSEFVRQFAVMYPHATIHAFSRHEDAQLSTEPNIVHHLIDYSDESSIAAAALVASKELPLDRVVVATGILNDGEITAEKSLSQISATNLHHLYEVNTVLPALIAKHFLPRLNQQGHSIFAVLSARVGSISDNKLGGWYAYRASKAALNMIIKTAAIEMRRRCKDMLVICLHPGTVDSSLSKPFQTNIPPDQLFTAQFAVSKLLTVMDNLTPDQSGLFFAWDGVEIDP